MFYCFHAFFFSHQGQVSMTTKWNVMLNFTFPVSPHMAFSTHSNMDGTAAIQMPDITRMAAGSWPWEGGPLSFGSSCLIPNLVNPQMVGCHNCTQVKPMEQRCELVRQIERPQSLPYVTNLSCSCIKRVARKKKLTRTMESPLSVRFKLREPKRLKRLFIWDKKKQKKT